MINQRTAGCHVHISGEKCLANELLHIFLARQEDPPFTCSLGNAGPLSTLPPVSPGQAGRQTLVLQDCLALERGTILKNSEEQMAGLPPGWHLACFNVEPCHYIEEETVSLGIRGVFYRTDSLATLKKGVAAIFNNELWFSRNALSASLSSFVRANSPQAIQNGLAAALTRREKEILRLVANNLSSEKIAAQLSISPLTLKTHLRNIYHKIDVPNRMQAIFWANEHRPLLMR